MPKRVGRTFQGHKKGGSGLPKFGSKPKKVSRAGLLSFETNRRPGTGKLPSAKGSKGNGPKMFRGSQRLNPNVSNLGERFIGK